MHSSSTELSTADKAEELLLTQPQVGCEVTHFFGPGVYVRTVTVEAGVFIASHKHRLPHLNIVLAGAVSMRHEDETDSEIRVVQAPHMYVSPPGRKLGWVLQKLVWQNIFATRETDLDALEDQLFDKSPAFRSVAFGVRQAQAIAREADRIDFMHVLDEYNITPEQARELSEREDDMIPMAPGYPTIIRESPIEGKGVYSCVLALPGAELGPARINGKRTPLGRYLNHSRFPNAIMVERNGNAYLMAYAPINPFCSETVPGDEITVDYRQVLSLAGRLI